MLTRLKPKVGTDLPRQMGCSVEGPQVFWSVLVGCVWGTNVTCRNGPIEPRLTSHAAELAPGPQQATPSYSNLLSHFFIQNKEPRVCRRRFCLFSESEGSLLFFFLLPFLPAISIAMFASRSVRSQRAITSLSPLQRVQTPTVCGLTLALISVTPFHS